MFSEQVPPQNLEAEMSVLGAMIIDKDCLPVVRKILRPDDFYADKNAWLYEAMCAVMDRHEPVDLITVQDELRRKKRLDDVGGLSYLTSMVNLVPSTANVKRYAEIVADRADTRRIQNAARLIVGEGYKGGSGSELKTYAMGKLQAAVFHRGSTGLKEMGPNLLAFIEKNRNAVQEGKTPEWLVKVPFQYQHKVMPLLRGETTAIGAGSSVGKTTYMFNVLLGVARLDGPAIGFSLEMSETQMMQKWWARLAGINTLKIRHAALTDEEWERSSLKAVDVQTLPVHYMVKPRMTWTEIAMEAAAFKARYGSLSLIFIDYWQILHDLPLKDERRDTLLGRLVEEGKTLAVELNCHVAFLVQTRIVPGQVVPTLADVLESRDIVRYADNSLFLTRPTEHIGKMTDRVGNPKSPMISLPSMDGQHWVSVAVDSPYPHIPIHGEQWRGKRMFDNVMLGFQGKQRMGPNDVIPYWVDLPTGKMADLHRPWPWDNSKGATPYQEIPD